MKWIEVKSVIHDRIKKILWKVKVIGVHRCFIFWLRDLGIEKKRRKTTTENKNTIR